jgi:hypothetical protein
MRKAVLSALEGTFLPETLLSGGLTKFGRALRGIPNPRQNDAIFVGTAVREIARWETIKTLAIEP